MTELGAFWASGVIDTVGIAECQTMGGEDMSFFLQAVPGCWLLLGVCKPRQKFSLSPSSSHLILMKQH